MKHYEFQVKTSRRDPVAKKMIHLWVSVRPTGGDPYRYDTEIEAERMADMCYGNRFDVMTRVIEVTS